MEPPEYFWHSIASFLSAITVMTILWLASKFFYNVNQGFKRPLIVNQTYKLNNCTLLDPTER